MTVSLMNGFIALPGDSFDALTFGSRSGDFTIVNHTGFSGLSFTTSYTPASLTLHATAIGGDANLDGFVNSDDFNALASNFGLAGFNWLGGDFNGDSFVNSDDFNILAGNFGISASTNGPTPDDWIALASAVPEPAVLPLLTFGWVTLAARRRSSRP
jgi:hypothetical protein